MLSDTIITAAVGFAGVLVGAVLAPLVNARVNARTSARFAGGLAVRGLLEWFKGIDRAKIAPSRSDDDNYDMMLAIELTAIGDCLSLRWWEENRLALLAGATECEADTLWRASLQCWVVLDAIAQLGDAGQEGLVRLAEARRPAPSAAPEPHAPATAADAPVGRLDKRITSTVHQDVREAAESAKEEVATSRAASAEAGEQFDRDMAWLHFHLDYRLDLVRDAKASLLALESSLREATEVCRAIEKRNRRAFMPW